MNNSPFILCTFKTSCLTSRREKRWKVVENAINKDFKPKGDKENEGLKRITQRIISGSTDYSSRAL
jgi:hypothetical protein